MLTFSEKLYDKGETNPDSFFLMSEKKLVQKTCYQVEPLMHQQS